MTLDQLEQRLLDRADDTALGVFIIDAVEQYRRSQNSGKPMLADSAAAFSRGYACAVANLIRDHGMSTEAKDLFAAGCGSIAKLEAMGVDDFDLEVLRQHFR